MFTGNGRTTWHIHPVAGASDRKTDNVFNCTGTGFEQAAGKSVA